MKITTLEQFKKSDRYEKVMKRSSGDYLSIFKIVQGIMGDVKENGDEAIKKYTSKFDGVQLDNFKVSKKEIEEAKILVSSDFLKALKQPKENITKVHCKQLPKNVESEIETTKGVRVWKRWKPIEKIGVYIPGGKANYPSSVLMNVIPAQIAGCKKIVIVTPPQKDGSVAKEVLVTADYLGIDEIYKVGGVQAVAGLSYGTKTLPKVYKIVGPGNSYVTSAKMIGFMQGEVAIDSPAGPSEVLIIADETSNPKFIATDLMCDNEHGEDSTAVLLCTSKKIVEEVIKIINKTVSNFSTGQRVKKSIKEYGLFAVVKSVNEAIEFANDYAPEHIQIMTKDSLKVADKINNAGSVFVGNYTCKSAGDYATGANHVLPTGASAKMFSGLSVLDFVKLVEYQKADKFGLSKIRNTIETFSKVEELPIHGYSCAIRFDE